MQRCRAWLRLHGITSKLPAPTKNAGLVGDDREPPPYHDVRTTIGPAADIVCITSAITTVAIAVPSAFVSINTTSVVELISRMAHAIATTPHARDYHRWGKPWDGHQISVAGTAEALMTGLDSYLDIVLMHLAWGDGSFSVGSRNALDALGSIHDETTISSPLASARILMDHFPTLCHTIHSILSFVQPVACVPAVATTITSTLARVADTVAAAPEESMAALAELHASYADRTAHSIVSGIIDAQSLRDGRAPVTSITTSHSSAPKSGATNMSVRRTRDALQG
jgi:hypothetical protein